MGLSEEIIVRTAVGTVLGLALNSFLSSLGRDVFKPIVSRKAFNKLEHEFTANIYGVTINYGDLLGHFISLLTIIAVVYFSIYILEVNKFLN